MMNDFFSHVFNVTTDYREENSAIYSVYVFIIKLACVRATTTCFAYCHISSNMSKYIFIWIRTHIYIKYSRIWYKFEYFLLIDLLARRSSRHQQHCHRVKLAKDGNATGRKCRRAISYQNSWHVLSSSSYEYD